MNLGRPKISRAKRRSRFINFRVTAAEFRAIKRAAGSSKSPQAWARECVMRSILPTDV